jgi:alpha-D-xyloside xylohydrolase
MTETEPWKYGQKVEDNMRKALDLRYSLMPYIYSEAWQITKNGSTLMRPLLMDFCNDASALQYPYEYMFGKSLLVAPVTEAGAKEWKTYLPKAAAWYDFRIGEKLAGGKETVKPVSLDMIPVYVKAGAILPIGPKVQYATEKKWDDLEIRVYPGANGSFTLYEDENDTYNYEKGAFSTIRFVWNDKAGTLTIESRKGTYPGMITNRRFHIVLVNGSQKSTKTLNYSGKQIQLKIQ